MSVSLNYMFIKLFEQEIKILEKKLNTKRKIFLEFQFKAKSIRFVPYGRKFTLGGNTG